MQTMNTNHPGCPRGLVSLACSLALLAAGCTHIISKDVDDQGNAGEVIFPEVASQEDALERGIFPNLDNLRKIKSGVTKDDLYYLVGRPHFRETHGAREWDYVFKFHEGDSVVTCQYKVIFDTEMKGRTFHWKPAPCADRLNPKVAEAAREPRKISLKADALFPFDKYTERDMRPAGREQLDALANELKPLDAGTRITITGHTDRLGSDAYNQRLSQRRADTVRNYLIARGIPAGQMSAQGMGEQQPVTECGKMARKALIDCLEPNRRVDIEVSGMK